MAILGMTVGEKWSRAVEHYAALLGLTNWGVATELSQLPVGIIASTDIAKSDYKARVRLDPTHQADAPMQLTHGGEALVVFPATLDECAAHELLHLVIMEYEETVDLALAGIDGDSPYAKALAEQMDTNLERLINRIAAVLARELPS